MHTCIVNQPLGEFTSKVSQGMYLSMDVTLLPGIIKSGTGLLGSIIHLHQSCAQRDHSVSAGAQRRTSIHSKPMGLKSPCLLGSICYLHHSCDQKDLIMSVGALRRTSIHSKPMRLKSPCLLGSICYLHQSCDQRDLIVLASVYTKAIRSWQQCHPMGNFTLATCPTVETQVKTFLYMYVTGSC